MKTVERVNADEAARDPQRLFREAAEGGSFVIVDESDVPAGAVVMSMADLDHLKDDLETMSVLLVRVASDSSKRHSLDDVMGRFGYSQADLDSAPD